MIEEKRNMLDSIGFTWKLRATPIYVDWEVHFQQLVEYKIIHGHCNITQGYNANQHLGRWVSVQRTNKETMSENKRNQLDAIARTNLKL